MRSPTQLAAATASTSGKSGVSRKPVPAISWYPTCPIISVIPFAANLSPDLRAALTVLSGAYNEVVYMPALRESEDGIIPSICLPFNEIRRKPQTYGFTNVTGTACPEPNPLADRSPVSLACGPEGSGYPVRPMPPAPTGNICSRTGPPERRGSRDDRRLVTSTLAAPVQVSLAGEGGVEMAGIHRSAVSAERMADLGLDRSVGSWRAYVTGPHR